MLSVKGLQARVEGKEILKGLDLEVRPGEIHAIMGPIGSGKSTFAHVLAGREGYEVTRGSVQFEGQDLLALAPEERAQRGLFLAFQYPVELPGVNNTYFLKTALNAIRKSRGEAELDAVAFLGARVGALPQRCLIYLDPPPQALPASIQQPVSRYRQFQGVKRRPRAFRRRQRIEGGDTDAQTKPSGWRYRRQAGRR